MRVRKIVTSCMPAFNLFRPTFKTAELCSFAKVASPELSNNFNHTHGERMSFIYKFTNVFKQLWPTPEAGDLSSWPMDSDIDASWQAFGASADIEHEELLVSRSVAQACEAFEKAREIMQRRVHTMRANL